MKLFKVFIALNSLTHHAEQAQNQYQAFIRYG
jgi:hypothetical protein